MKHHVRKYCRLATLLLLLEGVVATSAAAQPVSENDVKAAMVYNFLRFSALPRSPAKILLCVSAAYEGFLELRALEGKLIGNAPIHVEVIEEPAVPSQTLCHVVVYGELSRGSADGLRALTKSGVLTIGQSEQFLRQGGIIKFFSESKRVRFEIDNELAREAGIAISSKVLALARSKDRSE